MPATSDVYIGGSETYIATLATPLMVLDQVGLVLVFFAYRSSRGFAQRRGDRDQWPLSGDRLQYKIDFAQRRAQESQVIF